MDILNEENHIELIMPEGKKIDEMVDSIMFLS